MKDRSTLIDLLLAFSAIFVITLAFWPKTTPLQIVRCNTADEGWKTYSIELTDPSLDELRKKVHQWKTPEFHPQYVTAKWQKEVAEFYEKCEPCTKESDVKTIQLDPNNHQATTATISDTVAFASYEEQVGAKASFIQQASFVEPIGETKQESVSTSNRATETNGPETSSHSDTEYWTTVKASAEASMQEAVERTENVPVVFAGVIPSVWSQLAFHFAFLLGIAAACGYMHWLRHAPVQKGTEFRDQPIGVLARIGTFSGAVLLAMLSAVSVWIY